MKTFLTIIITAALAAGTTWFFVKRGAPASAATSSERAPLFYQSAMHPWIKSDKPGRCTICGMELTPVYEGGSNLDATGGENVVALTQSQIQVVNVQTVEASVQPLTRTLQVAGIIDDDTSRHRIISAYVDGRIDKLHVNFQGAEVTAGQPLADFYSPSLLQTEREYRQLTGELKSNTALRLRQMGLTPEQIQAVAGKPADSLNSPILSPIGGTVVTRNVYEGQYVTTGERLFEVADFSTMWFQFLAYEQDLPWIRIGQTVEIRTPSRPGKTYTGQITFIDPNFDEATRSTKVRVELANPLVDGRRELLHKLYAEGSVRVEAPPVLTVPKTAVIRTGPEAVVYIDRDGGAYAQTPVKLGRRGDSQVEILSGLAAGDKVVTNGTLLIDGQAEMNRAFMPAGRPPVPVAVAVVTPLTEFQQKAIRDFVQLADAMSAALAADDLAAFIKASAPAMKTTGALTEALAGFPGVEALDAAKHFHDFEDLKAARAAFHPFSLAATAVLEPLRKSPGFPELKVWECPMVDQAIAGAPKKGRWIQGAARAGQNPFFGAEMLDCVKEIKP